MDPGPTDRLADFAGTDPGTWSLIATGVLGAASFLAGAVVLLAAWRLGSPPSPSAAVDLLVASATVGAGVTCGAWYGVVERRESVATRDGAAVGAAAGVLAGPAAWLLAVGWPAGSPSLGAVVAGYAAALSPPELAWVVAATAAVPVGAASGAGTAVLRRRIVGEASDAAVRDRLRA